MIMRTVNGTLWIPFVTKWVLAALFRSCSRANSAKSTRWWTVTVRRPMRAAPMAIPVSPFFRDRHLDNSIGPKTIRKAQVVPIFPLDQQHPRPSKRPKISFHALSRRLEYGCGGAHQRGISAILGIEANLAGYRQRTIEGEAERGVDL